MTYRYVSDVMDGVRRLVRMLLDNIRKTEFRRKALTPGANGRPRWEFPTTWLMDHHTGYWQAIAIPKMEEKISKSAWKTVLHGTTKNFRAAGESSDNTDIQTKPSPVVYPAGAPLTPEEIKSARAHRPRSADTGEYLRCDFSSHAGCPNPDSSCAKGKRETIKTRGLHPLVKMHLTRRGGHRSEKRVLPADADGCVQILRNSLKSDSLHHVKPKGKAKYKPKASGMGDRGVDATTDHWHDGPHGGLCR